MFRGYNKNYRYLIITIALTKWQCNGSNGIAVKMAEAWANRGQRSCDRVIHCFKKFPWRTFYNMDER